MRARPLDSLFLYKANEAKVHAICNHCSNDGHLRAIYRLYRVRAALIGDPRSALVQTEGEGLINTNPEVRGLSCRCYTFHKKKAAARRRPLERRER